MEEKIDIDIGFVVKGFNVLLKVIKYGKFDKILQFIPTNVGLVLKIGEEAYKEKTMFPNGPRCKIGDVVLWSEMVAPIIVINNEECVFVSDTSIVSRVPPENLKHYVDLQKNPETDLEKPNLSTPSKNK